MSAPPFANLTAFATRLAELVPDNRPSYTRTDIVREALRLYSQDYPCVETRDIGDGSTKVWALDASPFTGFVRGFSEQWPLEVEILEAADTPSFPREELVEGRDFILEAKGTGGVLYLRFESAPATGLARVRFSRPWVVDDGSTTATVEVPLHHQEAVVKRAASYACDLLASHYLKTVDAALGSDAFSAMDVVEKYQQKARDWMRAYREALGVGESTSAALGRCRTGIGRVFPDGVEVSEGLGDR